MRWDPQQYVRYSDERSRPFGDLLARVDLPGAGERAPTRIVDVGCGPGPLTASLTARWPTATVVGLDSSSDMIDAAAPLATDRLSFAVADASTWVPDAGTDLVVSNAALQWVPDHLSVLRRWADSLAPGAWLAVQVPGNFGSPSHVLMRELAESAPWRERLAGVLRHGDAVAEPPTYAALLADAGLSIDVWETTYLHVLPGEDPVLQWVRGTGLRPVLAALSIEDAAEFERDYGASLRAAYPATAHGTPFPFRRIFAVAQRPEGAS